MRTNSDPFINADMASLEHRVVAQLNGEPIAIELMHGRTLKINQLWRSNDARRFRIVRILAIGSFNALVQNIVTGKTSDIHLQHFTVGPRGWSLEVDA